MARIRGEYHPTQVTDNHKLRHDEAGPHGSRDVEFGHQRPVLYDAHERPIYRRVGFAPRERGGR